MESNNSEYFYMTTEDYDKFLNVMSQYELWNKVQDYLDDKYPVRMDGYYRITNIRFKFLNEVYKKLDLGFEVVDVLYTTIKILDNKKWGYFKIKAEL